MPTYTPGSFSKNFGWEQRRPGLRRLYDAIRSGFAGKQEPVRRSEFRSNCGINDASQNLLPVNFFLHNSCINGENYVTRDELVRYAQENPHSSRFDLLALFAIHLNRMGKREGIAGEARPAGFLNHYVRTQLWKNGGWRVASLTSTAILDEFKTTIAAETETITKCKNNYLFFFEVTQLKNQTGPIVNTEPDKWIGPGLFLAFDRISADEFSGKLPSPRELLDVLEAEEVHKLIGTTWSSLEAVSPAYAEQYVDLGGLTRLGAVAPYSTAGSLFTDLGFSQSTQSSAGAMLNTGSTSTGTWSPTSWTDEDAEDTALVSRRLQEMQAQVRNPKNVRELKSLYVHTCMFCGKQTIVGVGPEKFYSEGAHIKPVGEPHNGPDVKSNMLLLCPEHHLQFDRGVLSMIKNDSAFKIISKVPGDYLHGKQVEVRHPHTLSGEMVTWHANYWKINV